MLDPKGEKCNREGTKVAKTDAKIFKPRMTNQIHTDEIQSRNLAQRR